MLCMSGLALVWALDESVRFVFGSIAPFQGCRLDVREKGVMRALRIKSKNRVLVGYSGY